MHDRSKPITLLCTGDSITDCGRREDPDGLGYGYVRRLSLKNGRIINTGIGGDLSADLAARWDRDVLAHSPDVVSVLIGINDVWRRYDGAGRITTAGEFAANVRGSLARLKAGTRLILIEPFVLPVDEQQRRWEGEDLGAKRSVIRDLAGEFGAAFVPAQEILAAAAAREGAATIARDGVHPTDRGHALLAEALDPLVNSF